MEPREIKLIIELMVRAILFLVRVAAPKVIRFFKSRRGEAVIVKQQSAPRHQTESPNRKKAIELRKESREKAKQARLRLAQEDLGPEGRILAVTNDGGVLADDAGGQRLYISPDGRITKC